MSDTPRKQCVVAYATRERQYLWKVDLAPEATIADAIEAARQVAKLPQVPWDSAPVGIFGELRARADRPADADRIEIYRPLRSDPRDRRRERVQRLRKGGGK
ncbi:MAG: RnfH family protein [Steroidobacteraceae bacterium]